MAKTDTFLVNEETRRYIVFLSTSPLVTARAWIQRRIWLGNHNMRSLSSEDLCLHVHVAPSAKTLNIGHPNGKTPDIA